MFQGKSQVKDQMAIYRSIYEKLQNTKPPEPNSSIDINILDNKTLDNNKLYRTLVAKIKKFMKDLEQQQDQRDNYQMDAFNHLYQVLKDVSLLVKQQDRQNHLKLVNQWFQEQQKLFLTRKQQGAIRHKTMRVQLEHTPTKVEQNQTNLNLPSDVIRETMLPYYRKSRTHHLEHQVPSVRLSNYKRKLLNIEPSSQNKVLEKPNRIKYPMPAKLQESKQDDSKKEEQPSLAQTKIQQEKQEQDEVPQLGEEPEEPEEAETQENTDDKLARKIKSYVSSIHQITPSQDLESKGTFLHSIPNQLHSERRMQEKYKRLRNDQLKINKQDEEQAKLAKNWTKAKSRATRELQKRLEEMAFVPDVQFCQADETVEYYLKEEDQKKYYFTDKRSKPSKQKQDIDFSIQLPRLSDAKDRYTSCENYEKSVEKSRINHLKKRFGNILNLSDELQQRQVLPKSICSYTSRFKAFSSIMQQHTQQKQRILQLEEVRSIKQRLTKNKVAVNVTTLAQGLCLPECYQGTQFGVPIKDLPKNPFIEVKKKKKKKK